MKYAGVGSRETPMCVVGMMTAIARVFAQRGYVLRSGGAKGADAAFELGAKLGNGQMEIFLATNAEWSWAEHAAKFHPNWNACTLYGKALHARNSAIVLGPGLNDPVNFVVCWTKDGKEKHGTGQALRVARHSNIPIYNLFNEIDRNGLERIYNLGLIK